MNEKINLFAQTLNLQWRLKGMIINEGIKIVDMINEYKRFEAQYEFDKKRIEREYKEIMELRKQNEEKR